MRIAGTCDVNLEDLKNGEYGVGCDWLYVDDNEDVKEYDEECTDPIEEPLRNILDQEAERMRNIDN